MATDSEISERESDSEAWSAVTEHQPVAASRLQRARRRAANPSYSGSPGCSESDTNGACYASDDVAHDLAASRQRISLQTLKVKSTESHSEHHQPNESLLRSEVESRSLIANSSYALHRIMQDIEVDTHIRSFPLQGGDSLAASSPNSLHDSARHSFCADETVQMQGFIEAPSYAGPGEIAAEFGEHLPDKLVAGPTVPLWDDHSDPVVEVLHSNLSKHLQTTNKADVLDVPHVNVSCQNASDSPDEPYDMDLKASVNMDMEEELLSDPKCSADCAESVLVTHLSDYAKAHLNYAPKGSQTSDLPKDKPEIEAGHCHDEEKIYSQRELRQRDEEGVSESSVSVGSQWGNSSLAPSQHASSCADDSPFTFVAIPDAGHGSPQIHCFKKTPQTSSSGCSPVSPNVVRALFTEEPQLHRTEAGAGEFSCGGCTASHFYLKRLWQAMNLIVLAVSFAASIYLLGRGHFSSSQRGASAQSWISSPHCSPHQFRSGLPLFTHYPTNSNSAYRTETSTSSFEQTKIEIQYLFACMWAALKQSVFRASVVLTYRLRPIRIQLMRGTDASQKRGKSETKIEVDDDTAVCGVDVFFKNPAPPSWDEWHANLHHDDVDIVHIDELPSAQIPPSWESAQVCSPMRFDHEMLDRWVEGPHLPSQWEGVEAGDKKDLFPDSSELELSHCPAFSLLLNDVTMIGQTIISTNVTADENPIRQQYSSRIYLTKTFSSLRQQVPMLQLGHRWTQLWGDMEALSTYLVSLSGKLMQLQLLDQMHDVLPQWHRMPGFECFLIVCIALALCMSVVSMIVGAFGHRRASEHHFSVNPGQSVRSPSERLLEAPVGYKLLLCDHQEVLVQDAIFYTANGPASPRQQNTSAMRQSMEYGQGTFYTACSEGPITRHRAAKVDRAYSDTAASPSFQI